MADGRACAELIIIEAEHGVGHAGKPTKTAPFRFQVHTVSEEGLLAAEAQRRAEHDGFVQLNAEFIKLVRFLRQHWPDEMGGAESPTDFVMRKMGV